jgi:hypothetical protein
MAEQLRGPCEKFVDSHSKKRPSPHLQKVPTRIINLSPRTFKTALVFHFKV